MLRRGAAHLLLLTLVVALGPTSAGAAERLALPAIADYVDVCSDAPAANDLRRLVFGPYDDSTYGVIVEGCEAGGATDWDLLVTLADGTSPDRRIRVGTVAGVASYTVTDTQTGLPLYTGVGRRTDDRSIQITVPDAVLAPVGDRLRLRVQAGDDALPDPVRPPVPYPSPCAGGAAAGASVVLRVEPGRAGAIARHLRDAGADVGTYDPALGMIEVDTTAAHAVAELRELAGVIAVEPAVPMAHTAIVPDDPRWPDQWALRTIRAPEAWEARSASAVTVAVVDDGIDAQRRDLSGRVVAGYDVIRRAVIPTGADSDLGGHGTSVAGIIGARGNDGAGMAGTDWGAALVPVRVFDEAGCASSADVAAGIRAAVDRGARIVNLSLGGPSSSAVLDDAIAYAVARDVLLVAAAGNAGPEAGPMYPAAHPDVIAVAATTRDDTIARYSNAGAHIELSAPGGEAGAGILTLGERDGFYGATGTSFAAPFVAGAAALYRAEHPTATSTAVRGALADAVVDLGASGRDRVFGHGRLDMAALLPEVRRSPATAGPCEGATPAGFRDVASDSVHADTIDCLVFLEITRGISDDRYGPGLAVTRGQMASFLARLIRVSGGSLPTANPDAFRDDDGTVHEDNIDALAAAGVVNGVSDDRYAPDAVVNRAQMATFLARAYAHVAGDELPEGPDAFGDDDGNAHEDNIDRVVAAGIATGRADGTYGPADPVRRDQMASFLVRLAVVLAGD